MAGSLAVRKSSQLDFMKDWSVTIQHEGGQTFYQQFRKVKKTGLFSDPIYGANFTGLPAGNYIVTYGGPTTGPQASSRRIVSVMDGQEATVTY